MIRVILNDPSTGESQIGGPELIAAWEASDSKLIWVDMEGEKHDDEERVLHRFGIHPLAIQDALRPRHPPKLERFNDFLFILLRGLDARTSGIDFGVIQLSLFIAKRCLITRHATASLSANWLFDNLRRDTSMMSDGTGSLAVRLSNRLARRYVEILLELEPRLDEIEEKMFRQPDDTLLSELTGYKSQLRKLTRIANYHQQIATKLRDIEDPLIGENLSHEIVDLYEQIERTQSLARLHLSLIHI